MPRRPRKHAQRRNFYWNLNNPTNEEREYLSFEDPPNQEQDNAFDIANFKFMVYQLESAPTTGTPHLQGFSMFNSAISRDEAIRRHGGTPGDGCRFDMRLCNGSAESNIIYCTKEKTRIEGPWYYGTRPAQGERKDLRRYDKLKDLLKAGRSLLDVAEEDFHSFLRFGRGLQSYQAMLESMPRETPRARTRLTIVLGHPGRGKNTWVRNAFPKAYWTDSGDKWFCGYIPSIHDTIVLDEFVGQTRITKMNQWLGVDPTRVETKGGSQSFLARDLVLMSNLSPMQWWTNTRVPLETIFRRIDTIVVFKEKFVATVTNNARGDDRSEPCEEIMRAMTAGF